MFQTCASDKEMGRLQEIAASELQQVAKTFYWKLAFAKCGINTCGTDAMFLPNDTDLQSRCMRENLKQSLNLPLITHINY